MERKGTRKCSHTYLLKSPYKGLHAYKEQACLVIHICTHPLVDKALSNLSLTLLLHMFASLHSQVHQSLYSAEQTEFTRAEMFSDVQSHYCLSSVKVAIVVSRKWNKRQWIGIWDVTAANQWGMATAMQLTPFVCMGGDSWQCSQWSRVSNWFTKNPKSEQRHVLEWRTSCSKQNTLWCYCMVNCVIQRDWFLLVWPPETRAL